MSTAHFSTQCKVCKGEVDSFSENIKFILLPEEAVQETKTIVLSCGCVIDFPDWRINTQTGLCKIYDFAGTLYLEFLDVATIYDGEDEE